MKIKEIAIIGLFAAIGWALCGAVIGIGRTVTSMEITLIVHAFGAPIIFGILSFIYFKKFHFTSPLLTAVIFVSFVMFMDFFLVALFIEKSFAMFKSILGTWLPFALIFLSTYLTGIKVCGE